MVTNRITSSAALAATAAIAFTACSGNPAATGIAGINAPSTASIAHSPSGIHHDIPPNTCAAHTPRVWASDLGTNQVFGYKVTGGAPCITLNGTEALGGTPFNAPFYLATDSAGNLYVADLGNDRVVRYTRTGAFNPVPTATQVYNTDFGGQAFQPAGVCVNPKGLLGVANRAYNGTGQTNFEIFDQFSGALVAQGGSSTLANAGSCAFDKLGDFFLSGGSTSGSQQIYYLARGNFSLSATLTNSGISGSSYWLSLFSRINGGANDYYLSADSPPQTCTSPPFCEPITTWRVSNSAGTGPPLATGPIYFTAVFGSPWTCQVPGYPNSGNAVFQAAPQKGGVNGALFIADYGNSSVEKSGPGSCADNANTSQATPSIFATPAAPVGVATYPTGQY